jgi:energy-coupling factor transport system ATP-binding protein
MKDAVVFDDVRFSYPEGSVPALVHASFSLPEGAFVLVTGATGAGKSTLLRCINGLVPHFSGGRFSGRVIVHGRNTIAMPPRVLADVVAFVPQNPAATFVLDRVEDELAYAMENLGIPSQTMRRRVEETLDLLDIEPLRARSVETLSGGERQRVAIASALTTQPRVLVLDEPTSQLDPQGAEDVLAALQRFVHDIGMTVVIAEHRLERVAGFADIAIACRRGMPVAVGSPGAVLDDLGGGPPVAELGRALGWRPLPLTVRAARRRAAGLSLPPRQPSRPRPVGSALVRASALAADYSGVHALRGVDLAVHRGEIVAVLGRNGAGKTTLLRCLAGLHAPRRGAVEAVSGPVSTGVDVGLCPQDPDSLLFEDSVADEVAATRERGPRGIEPDVLMERLGLAHAAHRHPRDLSAGERLLVAVATIAATGAVVLMLDEPTRGLDPDAKSRLAAFIRNHASGGAVVIATHDVELAAAVATRTVVLAGGEVVADGEPSEVMGDSVVFAPQTARVFGNGWLTPGQVADFVGAEGPYEPLVATPMKEPPT